MKKIYVEDFAKLDEFYEDWSLTFCGVIEDEIPLYLNFLKDFTELNDEDCYIFKGKLMNEHYNLTGTNRYPDDVTFLVLKLSSIKDVGKIAVPRFQIGGRWFTDIVDNNARMEA